MNKINYAELRDNIQYHQTPTPPFKAYFDSEIESEKTKLFNRDYELLSLYIADLSIPF